MAEEKELKQAQAAFDTLCGMLDEKDWKYEKDEENLVITSAAQGDDLPIDLRITVDPDRLLVILLSTIPFTIPEDRRTALAVAVSAANYGLVDGNFDYDYLNGRIVFRLTSCYRESLMGKEMFEYMLFIACSTVDNYNDKFLMVAKTDISYEEINKVIK